MGTLHDGEETWYEFTGELRRETAAALLVYDGRAEHWLPASLTTYEFERDGTSTFLIPEWLAIEKGIA